MATLLAREAALRAIGVDRLWLFGSVAQGEAGQRSDVDLFFETDRDAFSLIDYVGVQHAAHDLLPWRIDLIERCSLHPVLRPEIEATAVRIY